MVRGVASARNPVVDGLAGVGWRGYFCEPFILINTEMSTFRLGIDYKPRGDQATAIDALVRGLKDGEQHQVLLGVTGSGKTFTMAKVIEKLNRPALVLAHNKTLAAQLYQEFKTFFPSNAVEYFVSYYDYYQP